MEEIKLGKRDSAVIFREDGGVETFIPSGEMQESDEVKPGTPEWWAFIVTLSTSERSGLLRDIQALLLNLVEEPANERGN